MLRIRPIKAIINFLKENKLWAKIVLIIFGLSFLGGILTFFYPQTNILYPVVRSSLSNLVNTAQKTKDLGFWGIFLVIFQNNLTVASIIIFGGIFLGILPLFIIVINGLILGFFLAFIVILNLSAGQNLVLLLTFIPHATIELFSIFVAAFWGLRLGIEHFLPHAKGKRFRTFIGNLKTSLWVYVFVFLGLMIAAVVEVVDMKIAEALIR